MKDKEKWLKEIAGLTVFEAFRWVLVLILGWVLSLFGAQFLSTSLQFFSGYKLYLLAIFVIITTWATLWWFQRFNRNRPFFPKLDSDFHILEKEITFKYTSPTEIIYKRKYKLRALKKNLERFNDRYCWTGSTEPKKMTCSNKDQWIDRAKVRDVYRFFDVVLERAFQKGEEVNIEIIWELEDPNHDAGPFISATIFEPTDKLIMNVELADCLGVSTVIMEHSADTGTKKHYKTSTAQLSNRKYTWPIKTPNLLHLYRIRWQPHYDEAK